MIVDPNGQPLEREPHDLQDHCPNCGSTELARHTAFGGWWKLVCSKCFNIVSTGRGTE